MAATDIKLSAEELKELNDVVHSFEVKGARYPVSLDSSDI
jgi:hypothetical protein